MTEKETISKAKEYIKKLRFVNGYAHTEGGFQNLASYMAIFAKAISKQEAIEFGKWAASESWQGNGDVWENWDKEDGLTTEDLYELYLESKNKKP